MTSPPVRAGILNLRPTAAADAVAELEQRGVKLRSATWASDGQEKLDQNEMSPSSTRLRSLEDSTYRRSRGSACSRALSTLIRCEGADSFVVVLQVLAELFSFFARDVAFPGQQPLQVADRLAIGELFFSKSGAVLA